MVRVVSAPPQTSALGPNPVSIAVGDFNGDGKQDLATTNRDPANVSILLGDNAGNFSAATNFSAGPAPASVRVGDFNADGKQDLAVANAEVSSASGSVLLGDGVGNFSAPIRFGAESWPTASLSVAVGDFNGDGKQDLATAYPGASIWLRDCGPTPTPCPAFNVQGTVGQCTTAGPSGVPLAGVTMTLTGPGQSTSVTTDGSGNYFLSGFSCDPNTVTPGKADLTPGTAGITTVDVVAVQRHFLNIATLPAGCPTTAGNVNADSSINTADVIAIQRFALGLSTGIANVGKYQFTPASRSYSPPIGNHFNENYDAIVFGDVAQ